MINTNLSGQTNFRYYFIVWGFPCVVMLIIALLVAMRIGAQFGSSTIAEIGIFLITFLLQFLVYQAVFQQLPLYLCQLIFQEFELRARKIEANGACGDKAETNEVPVQETENPPASALPMLSAEQYRQRNEEYQAQLAAEKAQLVEIILDYVHHTMACFVAEEDMASLCSEILLWAENPCYTPNPVKLKVALTTVELRHFVWNIGERLDREKGYNGTCRLRFAKALFPKEFAGIEDDTIRNFTVDAYKGRIKLDRPKPGSIAFSHRDMHSA